MFDSCTRHIAHCYTYRCPKIRPPANFPILLKKNAQGPPTGRRLRPAILLALATYNMIRHVNVSLQSWPAARLNVLGVLLRLVSQGCFNIELAIESGMSCWIPRVFTKKKLYLSAWGLSFQVGGMGSFSSISKGHHMSVLGDSSAPKLHYNQGYHLQLDWY